MDGITFSAPTYRMKTRVVPGVAVGLRTKLGTGIAVRAAGCSLTSARAVIVYDLGTAKALAKSSAPVAKATLLTKATGLVHVPVVKLAKCHRFVVVVRNTTTHRVVSSARGTVR